MPPDALLEDAPYLQALHDPSPRLDVRPRQILQRARALSRAARLRRTTGSFAAAALVHLGFALAFVYLLSFRDPEPPRDIVLPVEIVTLPPEPPTQAGAKSGAAKDPPATREAASEGNGSKSDGAKVVAPGTSQTDLLKQALATPVAPAAPPPTPPHVQPIAPEPPTAQGVSRPRQAAPQPQAGGAPTPAPKLVAAPPEPTPAATAAKQDKPPNAEPDPKPDDRATHEARPAEGPRALATSDPKATFAVPAPRKPVPNPVEAPASPLPVKTPSATDQLAAALPMDLSAMPLSFRNVLSGNGAQVSAAYKGLVYGRFNRNAGVAERAQRQHLKGQVIVAFLIDDTGRIADLAVVQSSGSPALDALGLEMIRSAAPFPPPPPEAQRSFTPALSFGE